MTTIQTKERRSVSRQFHTKSRNGCFICRRRRVKCNLQSPTCANCRRRNEICSFEKQGMPQLNLARSSDTFTDMCVSRPGNGDIVKEHTHLASPQFDFLCNEEWLYGMPQSITDPTTSLVTWAMEKTFFLSWLTSPEKNLFIREFSHQASTFKYVQRTITSLCALHDWCQSTSRPNLYAAAHQYHIEASMLFRNSQIEVNRSNWIAILMFGVGVIVFQFAITLKSANHINDYLELLHVMRRSSNVASELGPFVQTSPLMLLTGPFLRRLHVNLDEFTWKGMCCLDSIEYPEGTTDEIRCACTHSIAALKNWVIKVDGHPGNWAHFIGWPACISDQYLLALSDTHPVALVIFIYWCAIMHRSPKRWYMVGWANRAANAAMSCLGEEWDYLLEFPRVTLAEEPKGPEFFKLALLGE
ncbi:hypothetical protein GGR54DRAFT_628357 [Hypoxylon sp. NC1633]|nr:hypothetical protein GGR54DRAFT_628357 [Hypoxylon sp. NC1633]